MVVCSCSYTTATALGVPYNSRPLAPSMLNGTGTTEVDVAACEWWVVVVLKAFWSKQYLGWNIKYVRLRWKHPPFVLFLYFCDWFFCTINENGCVAHDNTLPWFGGKESIHMNYCYWWLDQHHSPAMHALLVAVCDLHTNYTTSETNCQISNWFFAKQTWKKQSKLQFMRKAVVISDMVWFLTPLDTKALALSKNGDIL